MADRMYQESGGQSATGQRANDVSVFSQTKILVSKNWKSKKRAEFKKLLGEMGLPVFYLIILSFLVRLEPRKTFSEVTESLENPNNVLQSLYRHSQTGGPQIIHFVSSKETSQEVSELMKNVWDVSFPSDPSEKVFNFTYYSNVDSLMDAYMADNPTIELAIVMSDKDDFSYTIRVNPDVEHLPLPATKKIGLETCRSLTKTQAVPEDPLTCPVNGYFYSHFLAVQYLVDQALISKAVNSTSYEHKPVPVTMENYPKPAYVPGMSTYLRVVIPLYCIIPLAQLINALLILIVTEKENKIKDGLKMIGVSDMAYWCSWFAIYGAMAVMFAAMFTLVMHFMNVLKNINPVILFLLFMFFGLSIITFAFALTPFFHKPKTAGAVGTLIMQFTGMLFMLQTFLFNSSSGVLIPLRLLSSVAFTTALDDACAYEHHGGIGFGDLLPGRRGWGVLISLMFLAFDTILYGILAMYLDNVIPNEYGVRKHPLFFLSWSFWYKRERSSDENSAIGDVEAIAETQSDDVEQVHPSMIGKESIRIRNLKKVYNSWRSTTTVEAVKDISLDIYEGHITAILGRNGAGKSTLVNMMTGLALPSGGRCVIFGLDISDPYDMAKLRRMTGVCMQEDLHFPALTAEEHLEFYGQLRGISKSDLKQEITELLAELELTEQRNTAASKLSGGQKRKLSVGIALIGSPKIILLDEPSAGVDPVSRRQLWALLQRKKAGRVIILTTHFLDEADILADRKAIIHNGILKCAGSSLFLKSRFGVGYHLTIELDETKIPNSNASDEVIKKWVPDALESRKVIANEVKYALPHAQVQKFADLFGDFERVIESGKSNINSYGVSMTTLTEVFLKISNDIDTVRPTNDGTTPMPHRRMSSTSVQSGSGSGSGSDAFVTTGVGDNLIPNIGQTVPKSSSVFFAMCILRFRRLIRNPMSLFFMVFMPVIFVIIGFAVVKSQNISVEQAKVDFTLSKVSQVYSKDELDIGISKDSDADFTTFISKTDINQRQYSGNFAELLSIRPEEGTMAALSIKDASSTASLRLNGTFLHGPGLLLNAINQYFFNMASAKTQQATHNITTTNQPFPPKNLRNFDQSTFFAVFFIGPAFTFSAVGMVMEIVLDREKKTRNHLRVNGLSFQMYFASMFSTFALLSVFITVMEIIVIFAFSISAFTNIYAITIVVVLLILFIPPCLLFSAAFSYMFDRMETAQTVFSQVCSWMGSIVGIAMILIDGLAPNYSMLCHGIFCALDIFYIPFGIFYWTNKQYISCTMFDTCDQLSFSNYTGKEFIIMGVALLVQIPVFGIFLLAADVKKNGGSILNLLESLGIKSASRKVHSANDSVTADIVDEDVLNEKTRVDEYFSQPPSSEGLTVVAVQELQKSYQCTTKDKNFTKRKKYLKKVLNGVSLMVEEGEVFGLLGHNGAGKTSTVKMIIAEEKSDSGNIRLCGFDVKSNLSDAFAKLGYCPQHDALWDNITLQEHMELYAIIRGVQPHMQKKLVSHFLKGLQIEEHAAKKSKKLSGGTKRKLSYCISMLGAPKIVLLDEPSTGMDITSKRFLWNTVLGTFKDNRGAILTTHSMEEADALCTRIGIMVKGSLLCLGSPQHLKSKYGMGYILEIKLKIDFSEPTESVNQQSTETVLTSTELNEERFGFVKAHFPECKLNEIFENRAVFSIPKTSINSISQTFALLENLKRDYNIEEYGFSQTTLEQVFLQFAKHNEDNNDDD